MPCSPKIHHHTLVGFVAMFVLGAFAVPASGSALKLLILQPHVDEIQGCKHGLYLLQRQADIRLDEKKEWLGFLRNQHRVMDVKIEVLKQNWSNRTAKAEKEWRLAMAIEIDERRDHVEARLKHLKDLEKKFATIRKEIKAGEYEFSMEGLGNRTRKRLEKEILKQQGKIDDLQDQIRKGKWEAEIAGVGTRTLKRLRKCIADNEDSISEKGHKIARGEYRVDIPTLGEINRNELMIRIDKLEKKIREDKEAFKNKKWRIHRERYGYQSRWSENYLGDRINEKRQRRDKTAKKILENKYSVGIPGDEWSGGRSEVSKSSIQKQLKRIDKKIASIQAEVTKQVYRITVDNSFWTAKGIYRSLKSPNLTYEKKVRLEKGLRDIVRAYTLDLKVNKMNMGIVSSWPEKIDIFAGPALDDKQIDFDQWSRYRGEYPVEEEAVLAEKQNKLARLKAAVEFLP